MMEPKPCPFCAAPVQCWEGRGFTVDCRRCHARGPEAATETIAIKWWNEACPRAARSRRQALRDKLKRDEVMRAEAEAEANEPRAKRDREYRQWNEEREVWLSAPVDACHR
jgi:hypothetical protein